MVSARRPARALLAAGVIALTLGVAITATSVVPASRAGSSNVGAATAEQLKPDTCASLSLSSVVVGAGSVAGSGRADLIIGSAGVDALSGRGGSDCILGGSGNDSLRGDGGVDVCIGGPGADTFHVTCETRIQ